MCLDLTSLVTLFLDNNVIQQLPENLFLSLSNLRILRLSNNGISRVYSNTFTGMIGLRELDLSGNRIPTLPLGLFDPLGHLEYLSLANNEIQHVEYMSFQSCRKLRTLDMANNLLPGISIDWFVTTSKLSVLKLAHNRIESIQAGSFDQLQELEELDLRENYLSDLGNDSFAMCRSLQRLNLTRNPFQQLPSPGTTFFGLTALRQLDLRSCNITELVLNSSAPLPALTELYLADNLLSKINQHSLESVTSIERLDLSDNNIAAIEAGAMSSLVHLQWLILSRNLLTEDQLAATLQSLPSHVVVDASWNRVKSIASLTTPISGIYLSGNPLVCNCTSPSWISSANTSRFLDKTKTLCCAGNETFYLLCYWSRCGNSTDDPLCDVPISSTILPNVDPNTTCDFYASLTIVGPRFVDFDAHALSATSAQLSWNVSDEFNTMTGFRFTFTVVDNCTNASAEILSLTGNEVSYVTKYYKDVNLTTIDAGNLISGETFLTCAYVFHRKPTRSGNRNSVSDTRCSCLRLPEETITTVLPTTTTTWQTTIADVTTTSTTTPSTTTTTVVATTKRTEATTAVGTSSEIMTKPVIDFVIRTTSNETAVSVSWVVEKSRGDQLAYFRLMCLDDDGRLVESVDVDGRSYHIGNLQYGSSYNVCVTAVTYHSGVDLTRCVAVETDARHEGPAASEDTGVSVMIVVAVSVACLSLLLVLVLVCIIVAVYYRRRRRQRLDKPSTAEVTSSPTFDSPTVGDHRRQPVRQPVKKSNSLSAKQPAKRAMSFSVEEPVKRATSFSGQQPVHRVNSIGSLRVTRNHPRSWNVTDSLPLQSSLCYSIYEESPSDLLQY